MKETAIICPPPYAATEAALLEPVFFKFEADFVEDNVRCIPMIVRFKLDACGIKLKLQEWSRMSPDERRLLSELACASHTEIIYYRHYLQQLVKKHTGAAATDIPVDISTAWADTAARPGLLDKKAAEFGWRFSLQQWQALNNLQRFVLLKLCGPGHENRNFPKSVKEFGLV